MYLVLNKLKKLAHNQGLTLNILLHRAKVSKTAFYSLVRKPNLLPKSLLSVARILEVRPSTFIEESNDAERKALRRLKILEEILAEHPEANRENVWHTLILLEEKPIERLLRGMSRAQAFSPTR